MTNQHNSVFVNGKQQHIIIDIDIDIAGISAMSMCQNIDQGQH
jgi:hypothetical protein